jgi:hypothetical protein
MINPKIDPNAPKIDPNAPHWACQPDLPLTGSMAQCSYCGHRVHTHTELSKHHSNCDAFLLDDALDQARCSIQE